MFYYAKDIPVLKYLEDVHEEITDEFVDFYDKNKSLCEPIDLKYSNTPPTRFGYYGTGQNIIVYNNKDVKIPEKRYYEKELPNIHSIIDKTKEYCRPRFVYYAIVGPESGCEMHNDMDYEFKEIEGVDYRLLRAHVPLVVPTDCYFVHLFKKLPWVKGKVWAFDEVDLHYSKNDNPDHYRIMVEYDFLYEKDRV